MEVSARSAEPGGLDQRDGELLVRARTKMPFLNVVMRADQDGDAAAFVARAKEFFFSHERGFVVLAWPGDPELEEAALGAGLFPILERYPEMVCHKPLGPIAADVREVTELSDAAAYWRVCDEAYPSLGFPAGLFAEAYSPEDLLGQPDASACVAWDGDTPLACAAVFMAESVGMV